MICSLLGTISFVECFLSLLRLLGKRQFLFPLLETLCLWIGAFYLLRTTCKCDCIILSLDLSCQKNSSFPLGYLPRHVLGFSSQFSFLHFFSFFFSFFGIRASLLFAILATRVWSLQKSERKSVCIKRFPPCLPQFCPLPVALLPTYVGFRVPGSSTCVPDFFGMFAVSASHCLCFVGGA